MLIVYSKSLCCWVLWVQVQNLSSLSMSWYTFPPHHWKLLCTLLVKALSLFCGLFSLDKVWLPYDRNISRYHRLYAQMCFELLPLDPPRVQLALVLVTLICTSRHFYMAGEQRVPIALTRYHDHSKSYKVNYLTGWITVQRFDSLSSWWEMAAYRQTWCWDIAESSASSSGNRKWAELRNWAVSETGHRRPQSPPPQLTHFFLERPHPFQQDHTS